MNLRAALYRLASLLGDWNALARGKLAQRMARKVLMRALGRLMR